MPLFKDINFRLGMISVLFTIATLIVLPKIDINIDNSLLKLNSSIGGYNISLFGGKFNLDLSSFKKGLDIKGGVKIVMQADVSKIPDSERENALESAKEIISRRINFLGVTEPNIATLKTKDDYRIIVEIPGVTDVSEAVNLIGKKAQLRFIKLDPKFEWSEEKFFEYFQDPASWVDTGIVGSDLKGVSVIIDSSGDIKNQGKPQIQLKFTNEGREKFSQLAKENVGRPIALFLDDSDFPLSTPVISEDLSNGLINDPVISGNFDLQTAKNLSIQLRAGALPIPVTVLQQETLGATLGNDSIHKSFFAGIVGLSIVFLFLVYKYKGLGLLAGLSLIFYSILVLAIFKLIPVVLTLPGIAGFILSIGMATDANILIFERYKEELFWGKDNRTALELGFERAWNSIKDSNISSLITCFILFQLGTGSVRGFALTLAIGILVSLFSSIFVVRTFIKAFKR